ncbi:glycoside hydrolase family 3 N-terminal domain-containing protein [Saccharicrinis sp. FJH2]|uniref:glycoside hydrolase family 3 N-terminal domain-containing protein n=1 Tax=Saccharicrinis sp. FJH65 TaxID=3344659 RepID=UPI0035F3D4C0
MNKVLMFCLLMLSSAGFAQNLSNDFPWFDGSKSFDERIDLLLQEMTLEEKSSQLLNASPAIERLGIFQYNWWSEALHGVARSGRATVFPQAIGLAATFDPDLEYRIGDAISDEARAINNDLVASGKPYIQYMGLSFWSPNVNIFRDPRWGRGQETFGEDPFLSGSMGAAFIKGMQGDDPKYLKTAACAKHFAVHSGPEADRHHFDAVVSDKDLYETYLPAFKMCVDAGVEAVMCAYNRTNHLPCCGSNPLLVDILRNQWGFNGHIVSDCGAIANFHRTHHVTETAEQSAAMAIKSGVDINCGSTYHALVKAVNDGLISEIDINNRLREVLRTRFELGLFDPPADNPYTKIPVSVINSQENRALAREAALKSVVLLQNKNNTLPLKKDLNFVYIGGPFAGDIHSLIGNYHGLSDNMVTLVEGVVSKTSPSTRVGYRAGTLAATENKNPIDWYSGQAGEADVTIVGMGLTMLIEGEEGEAIASEFKGDNLSMKLPEAQMKYLRKIVQRKGNKKLVVVLFAGSPLDLTEISNLADAIVYAWYPGEEGGNAVADIIFGDASPSGKLPITFPKSLDQLPPYDDYNMENRTYKYMKAEPMYPFGYGLTYGDIELGELAVEKTGKGKSKQLTISVPVQNNGKVRTDEVIQLYITLPDAKAKVPQADLKAFQRITLDPESKQYLSFRLTPGEISYINDKGETVNYKGKVKIMVGNASPGERSAELGASVREVVVDYK